MSSNKRQCRRMSMMLAASVGLFATGIADWAVARQDASPAAEVPAEGAAPTPKPDESHYEIIQLQSMNASDAARLVKSIASNCRVGTEERSNSVVVRGPRTEVLTTIEMLRKIDAAEDAKVNFLTKQVFNVDNSFNYAGDLVRKVVNSPGSRVSSANKAVYVLGTPQEIEAARQLLVEAQLLLDKVPREGDGEHRALMLNFYFIKARFQPDPDDPPSPPLPDLLKPVAEAMAEHAFHQPGLLASLLVRTEAGESFEAQGSIPSDDPQPMRIEVNGMTNEDFTARPLELQVSAEVVVPAVGTLGNPKPMIKVFQIETQIRVPLGEFIVLAATPSTADMFDAIALVVRVTAVDGDVRGGNEGTGAR